MHRWNVVEHLKCVGFSGNLILLFLFLFVDLGRLW